MNHFTHCTKHENWVKKSDGIPTHDFEITYPIDTSLGVGAKIMHDGEKLTTVRKNNVIELRITSWAGYSAGAVHVYGKLHIPGTVMITKDGGNMSQGGYGVPPYISGFVIDITRKITQEEIDIDKKRKYDKMWEWMHAGDNTTRFDTEEEIIKRATYIFTKWFTGGWEFKVKDD